MAKHRTEQQQQAYEARMKRLRESLQKPDLLPDATPELPAEDDGKLAEADLKILEAIIRRESKKKFGS
jgi:hypothetical protein